MLNHVYIFYIHKLIHSKDKANLSSTNGVLDKNALFKANTESGSMDYDLLHCTQINTFT